MTNNNDFNLPCTHPTVGCDFDFASACEELLSNKDDQIMILQKDIGTLKQDVKELLKYVSDQRIVNVARDETVEALSIEIQEWKKYVFDQQAINLVRGDTIEALRIEIQELKKDAIGEQLVNTARAQLVTEFIRIADVILKPYGKSDLLRIKYCNHHIITELVDYIDGYNYRCCIDTLKQMKDVMLEERTLSCGTIVPSYLVRAFTNGIDESIHNNCVVKISKFMQALQIPTGGPGPSTCPKNWNKNLTFNCYTLFVSAVITYIDTLIMLLQPEESLCVNCQGTHPLQDCIRECRGNCPRNCKSHLPRDCPAKHA